MPELPEVEAARKAIEESCLGKRIKRAVVANDEKVIDAVSPQDFESSIVGKAIISVRRKGKNMWLELDSPPFPSFQFGMAGAIYIKGVAVTQYKRSSVNDNGEWPSKYSKLLVQLEDGLEFSFTDKRRFAKVRLLADPVSVPPISELGPDAFLEPMPEQDFINSLTKKKIAIKALLLDQSYISGIGNWVADEVLYQAKLHPLQNAAALPTESCVALQKSIKEVLKKAVEVGADSTQYPASWIFHFREKKPDKSFVNGKKIDFIRAGGRTTAYVPDVQKLRGNQTERSRTKHRKHSLEVDVYDNTQYGAPANKGIVGKNITEESEEEGKGMIPRKFTSRDDDLSTRQRTKIAQGRGKKSTWKSKLSSVGQDATR